MTIFVLDASAAVAAFTEDTGRGSRLLNRISTAGEIAVPAHYHVEAANALRGMERSGVFDTHAMHGATSPSPNTSLSGPYSIAPSGCAPTQRCMTPCTSSQRMANSPPFPESAALSRYLPNCQAIVGPRHAISRRVNLGEVPVTLSLGESPRDAIRRRRCKRRVRHARLGGFGRKQNSARPALGDVSSQGSSRNFFTNACDSVA